jgi:pyruvate formate lyase activating enzyme
VEHIVEMAVSEKPFFGKRGGVTFSGGEPTVQAAELIPVVRRLKEEGIHVCLDTNGSIWNEAVEELLGLVDLVLLDVKEYNAAQHKLITERENTQTLQTAAWLEAHGKPFWLRYVLVPGYSDRTEDIRALGEHFRGYEQLQRVEVLPYHPRGAHKYAALGWSYRLEGVKENPPEQLEAARKLFEEYFSCVFVN